MSSMWQALRVENRVRQILTDVKNQSPTHHFGWGFITAYQLAIEFEKSFPLEAKKLGYDVGGKGLGRYNSLAQYLALQLSKKIKSGEIVDIEGAFISNLNLNDIEFDYNPPIHSSVTDNAYGTSMFRLKSTD